jgi:hypothetical protein
MSGCRKFIAKYNSTMETLCTENEMSKELTSFSVTPHLQYWMFDLLTYMIFLFWCTQEPAQPSWSLMSISRKKTYSSPSLWPRLTVSFSWTLEVYYFLYSADVTVIQSRHQVDNCAVDSFLHFAALISNQYITACFLVYIMCNLFSSETSSKLLNYRWRWNFTWSNTLLQLHWEQHYTSWGPFKSTKMLKDIKRHLRQKCTTHLSVQ